MTPKVDCPVCGQRIGGEHGTPAMAHDCEFPGCAFGPGHTVDYHLVDGQRVPADVVAFVDPAVLPEFIDQVRDDLRRLW